MEWRIQFCTTPDGVRIAYAVEGEGPFLVVPPGWVSHLDLGDEKSPARALGQSLAAHHTVVAYDKHGSGLSDRDRTEFTLEKELEYLETIIDHLELKRLALWGSSQGGPIAIAYTAKYPVRISHLILYGTYARGSDITRVSVQESIIALVRAHWGLGSKTLADLFMPGADADAVDGFSKFQREASSVEVAASLLELIYQVDVTDLLPQISAPTLILHRQGDRVMPFRLGRELAASIPNAHFIPLEGNIHPPFLGDSETLLNHIVEFLGTGRNKESEASVAQTEIQQTYKRKLAAILCADVQGYSRLMTDDEQATIRTLTAYREAMTTLIQTHRGRVVDAPGDNLLAEFASAVEAVQCAVEIQKELRTRNSALPETRRMEFRIGLNLGDVVEEGDRIYGDGVNICARIEGLSDGGGISISGTIYDQVKTKIELDYEYQGEQSVKNMSEPVRVYRIRSETKADDARDDEPDKVRRIY